MSELDNHSQSSDEYNDSFSFKENIIREYLKTTFWGVILSVLTLSLYFPYLAAKQERILWNNPIYFEACYKR